MNLDNCGSQRAVALAGSSNCISCVCTHLLLVPRSIRWFPAALCAIGWAPARAPSAGRCRAWLPRAPWPPSTPSVRTGSVAPRRTCCPNRVHTRCPTSMARSTTASRGKVGGATRGHTVRVRRTSLS